MTLDEVARILHSTGDVVAAALRLANENSLMKKSLEKLQMKLASLMAEELKSNSRLAGDISFISLNAGSEKADMLKTVAGILRNNSENCVAVLGAADEGKATLVVMVSDDLVKSGRIDAVKIIREIAPEIAGSGGGQPFLAIAGGKNPDGIDKALSKAKKITSEMT
jgi:alanyl-tRNA synthetase